MPKAQNSPIRMYFLIQALENNGNTSAESECKICGLRMKVSASNIFFKQHYIASDLFTPGLILG